MTDTIVPNTSGNSEHSLKPGVLGLFDSAIMGIAGSAPAYSISATTLFLFANVGFGGAASLLYCGFFMFGIVFAFNYLSKSDSTAGATYSWVRRALHPYLGYLAGWALIVSALIFMVIATFPAGSNLLDIFRPSLASNKTLITILGAVFFLLMVAAVAAGVTVTVTVQIIMSCIEIALLLLFAGLAIFHAHVVPFSWHWFSPSIFSTIHGNTFFAGALLAAFYYWGWDVTANLNEETKDPGANKDKKFQTSTSGLGGILGTIVVFLLFEVFTIASNMVIPAKDMGTNSPYSADILAHLGQIVAPGWFGKFIVVSVLLSTIATLETTLIQVTRTLFSMGRDKTLPAGTGSSPSPTPYPHRGDRHGHRDFISAVRGQSVHRIGIQHPPRWILRHRYSDLYLLRTRWILGHCPLSPPALQVRQEFHLHGPVAAAGRTLHDRGLL